MNREFLRSIKKSLLTAAWYLGPRTGSASVPRLAPRSYYSNSASFFGAQNISIGEGVYVADTARMICGGLPPYVMAVGSISLGEDSIVRESAMLITYGGTIQTGPRCTINPFSLLQGNGGITIGEDVLIASHVSIISANHQFRKRDENIRTQGETAKGIVIEDDVWIATHATILDGVTIGRGAVVAASALVNRDVPPYSIVAGVPAKVVGERR